jgi:hypothetical protein
MAKTPEKARSKPEPPLTDQELIKLDNVIKRGRPPDELRSLVSPNSFVVPKSVKDFKPESALRKITLDGYGSAWNLLPGQEIIMGLPVQTMSEVSGKKLSRAGRPADSLEGARPAWCDLIYHPKLAGRPRVRKGRRGKVMVAFSDPRLPFVPSGYPWACIGKLIVTPDVANPSRTISGTASLVGRNVIVTSGHLLPWGAAPFSSKAQFIPAYFNGSSTVGPSVASFVTQFHGYDPASSDVGHDMAVGKLADALGDPLGFFGFQTYSDSWNNLNTWFMVGYPAAVAGGEQPSWQQGISFHDDDEYGDAMQLESQNCVSSPGDSGAACWKWWSDGWPKIVGIHSANEEEYVVFTTEWNSVAAGGQALSDLIQWARTTWAP